VITRGPRNRPAADGLHVFLGTQAEIIKTAPLMRLMDARGVPYRFIEAGQHGALSGELRAELGVRAPDFSLGHGTDAQTIPQALRWATGLVAQLPAGARLRREVFGGRGGICVVHGDTPSTLLSTLMARRAGLRVAHIEAGLRSHRLLHPFPEEMIRLAVMRLANLLFAPDDVTVANLTALRVRGEIVPIGANTMVEALRFAAGDTAVEGDGPVIVTLHRVENLHQRRRVDQLVEVVGKIAAERPLIWFLHGPTRQAFARYGVDLKLRSMGIDARPLASHGEFAKLLCRAPYVITDGGSMQEECAALGVPVLLWRLETERTDGLGANVVVSRYDPATVAAFLADPQRWRREPAPMTAKPSERILDVLLDRLAAPAP